jgi:hypothetical protein
MASEKRDVAGFSKVELLAAGEIHLEQAAEFSLRIGAEEAILERLTSEVRDETLLLGLREGQSITSKEPIQFFITMPKIDVLRISGGGKIFAGTIAGNSLLIDLPGAGDIRIESIKVNAFQLDVKGAGKMRLNSLAAQGVGLNVKGTLQLVIPDLKAEAVTSNIEGTLNLEMGGKVNAQIIHAPGVITYQAGDLYSSQVTLNAQGMANLTLWVEDNLSVRLQGVGNLRYYGSPERSIKINGLGNVQRLGDKPKVVSYV